MSTNVVVSNTVALNGGDAAILMGIERALRQRVEGDLNLTVFDSQPEVASRLYPGFTFRRLLYDRATRARKIERVDNRLIRSLMREISRRVNPARVWLGLHLGRVMGEWAARSLLTEDEYQDLSTYASADLIISTGGTYLVDYYFLEPRIFDYRIAHFFKVPLVFYTQSVGPIDTPRYRRALRSVMNRARLILLRDGESIENLRAIGITDTPLVEAADAAFSLADTDELERALDRSYPAGDRMKVAVSVRDWPHFRVRSYSEGMRKYRESIRGALVRLVRKHRAEVTFLSTCQGVPEYHADDSKVAREIARSLPAGVSDAVTVDEDFRPPGALRERLRGFDFAIATRMHMAILALTVGTPVLPIAYEEKTTQLFRKMGLASWSTDIEEIDLSFRDDVDRFIEKIDDLRRHMLRGAEQERRRADAAARRLGELIREIEASS